MVMPICSPTITHTANSPQQDITITQSKESNLTCTKRGVVGENDTLNMTSKHDPTNASE